MRRLAGRLLAQTPSHARSRRLTAAPAPEALDPSIPFTVATTRPTTSWHHGPLPLLSQKPQIYLVAPLSQDPSRPTTATTTSTSRRSHTTAYKPPLDDDGRLDASVFPRLPFRFDTGIALFAKRTPRPFPPPFLSPPSGSFSDPLSTHDRSRDRRPAYVGGRLIQGFTNGDDAVFASEYFICANDGVGAWSTRPRGHAGLWARLILHFWATTMFEDAARQGDAYVPDPVSYLQRAYEQTIEATGPPNDWLGTTTVTGAQLHYRRNRLTNGKGGGITSPEQQRSSKGKDEHENEEEERDANADTVVEPLLYVTNLGDSQVMVIRPSTREMVYKSTEQWHWFDCPRQLGTNSPDTPVDCAVVDAVPIREGDVVLAMSDGVIDNLWAHEIVEKVSESLERWRAGEGRLPPVAGRCGDGLDLDLGSDSEGREDVAVDDGGMGFVAEELMEAAKAIAVDPFAESPFMEHAIEEGLASGGGKLDDISVVAAICRRNGPR